MSQITHTQTIKGEEYQQQFLGNYPPTSNYPHPDQLHQHEAQMYHQIGQNNSPYCQSSSPFGVQGGRSQMTPTRAFLGNHTNESMQSSNYHNCVYTPRPSGYVRTGTPSRGSSQHTGSSTPTTSHMTSRVGEQKVLNERFVETAIKVPRVKVVEETVDKVVVIPETIRREEIVEETQRVRERIVEVEKPIYQQTYVEVPDIQFVEKRVEVPQTIFQDQVREVPKVEIQEHITYKPKVVIREKIEEVPEVEIVEVIVERIVEIPEVREQIVVKEVPVDRYVDCPVAEYVDVEIIKEIERHVPVPLQAVVDVEYKIPKIKTRYEKIQVPIYAPKFVEVAVPIEQMDEETYLAATQILQEIAAVSSEQYPSLCEIETVAANAKSFVPSLKTDSSSIMADWKLITSEAIHSGGLPVTRFQPSNNHQVQSQTTSQQGFQSPSSGLKTSSMRHSASFYGS